MHNLVQAFLSVPVGGRVTIFTGVLFLLWCTLARPILKITSFLLWLLKKLFFGIYMLLEIPVSALHSMFGSVFGGMDQGLTTGTEKVCDFLDKLFKKINKPKTIYSRWLFIVCVVIGAYLLIPIAANLTEKPFTFWQEPYIKKEMAVVQWMADKGWFEKGIGIYPKKNSEVASNVYTHGKYYKLNKTGASGSNIRNKPNLYDSKTLTVVKENDLLLYLNESLTESNGILWYKVKTPKGSIGWISSRLVQEVK